MSKLSLKAINRYGRTQLSDCYFSSPLKVAKPFYREDGYTEAMVLIAGPGMLKGDSYDMAFEAKQGARALITAQSYQKLFNCDNGNTTQNVVIKVDDEAELCYIPQPIIPFNKNSFTSNMEINLNKSSKFFFTDVIASGRLGMGEKHLFLGFSSRVVVNINGRTVFLDNTHLFPKKADFDSLGFFEGYPCQGLIYIYGYGDIDLPKCSNVEVAVSKSREGHSIRLLSNSADDAHKYCMKLWDHICKGD